MGQVTGEESGGIFDAATGQPVGANGGQQVDSQAKAAQIKADTKTGKITREEAIKQLQSIGYK